MVSELSIFFSCFTPPQWSLCGRYASYWNAFLLDNVKLINIFYIENNCFSTTVKSQTLQSLLGLVHTVQERLEQEQRIRQNADDDLDQEMEDCYGDFDELDKRVRDVENRSGMTDMQGVSK